jgi:hypothetical protein
LSKLKYKARFLCQGDELGRRDHALARGQPADQGLRTDQATGLIDLRLVIQAKLAFIQAAPQGYVLVADMDIVLNPTLEDALLKGINLHFLLELELSRARGWWWFDEGVVEASRKMRIYYHLLLRRYVIEIGYVTKTAGTLEEALELLGTLEGWQVLERGALKNGRRYDARLRVRLDTAQLPKPLHIGAVSGDRWDLSTPWHEWSFKAPVADKPMPLVP